VGGLYGVALGGAFFGESMFSRMNDASKVSFVALVERLRERGFSLLDTQYINDFTASLGAIEIPDAAYQHLLQSCVDDDVSFV
jgi:leucyl/phenylalanyl-tRNA--protein transferase